MKNLKIFGLLFFIIAAIYGGTFLTYKRDNAHSNRDNPPKGILVNEKPTSSNFSKTLNSTEEAIIQLFETSAPSVCFITTANMRQDYWSRNIQEIPRGTGSGFVWDKNGHIVTNYHVIKGADRAQVTLSDQTTWEATLVGVAPEKDLAVLKIKAKKEDLHPIHRGNSNSLRVGQFVMAIGNPFGLDQTLTTGVISALDREIESQTGAPIRGVIQTDAAINPGNSGGPLLNSSGELIGVNTSIYSPSGASAGIGFSIPAGVVNWVVPELIKYGKIKRPSLGIELARAFKGINGAVVYHVYKDSNAEKVGIRPTMVDKYNRIYLGDVIVGLNGQEIKSNDELQLALEDFKVGDVIKLTVIRSNKEIVFDIELEEPK